MKLGMVFGPLVAAVLLPAVAWAHAQAKPQPPARRQTQAKPHAAISADRYMVKGYGAHPERMDRMVIGYGGHPERMDHMDLTEPTPQKH